MKKEYPKGFDISQHKVRHVGGGGRCGANCISLHTTGTEEMAAEIVSNKNKHIVKNWENIYKTSFQFPYTKRVGGKTITFLDEVEFLRFLETKDATDMWMTHVCMQAVSSMPNMNISIMTTGISAHRSHNCPRCKSLTVFTNAQELRKHTEVVHHRTETEEEREGRINNVRWTHLTPDNRIGESLPNEKDEELILLHEDEVHFNIIVQKSHNAFKKVNCVKKSVISVHSETIFGDTNSSPQKRSWADITKVHRPVYHHPGLEDSIIELKSSSEEIKPNTLHHDTHDEDEWQVVVKRDNVSTN